jgi:hypothetical protein
LGVKFAKKPRVRVGFGTSHPLGSPQNLGNGWPHSFHFWVFQNMGKTFVGQTDAETKAVVKVCPKHPLNPPRFRRSAQAKFGASPAAA